MWDIYKKVNALLNPREKRSFFILIVVMLVEALLEMLGIGIIPVFVSAIAYPDHLLQNPLIDRLGLQTISQLSRDDLIYWGSGILLAFFTVKTLYSINSTYWKARYAQNRALKLSQRLYKAYLEAPYTYHLEHSTPELMRNINGECTQLSARVLLPMVNIISQVIILVGVSVVLVYSVPLSVLAWLGVFLLIATGSAAILNKRLKNLGMEAQHNRAMMVQAVKEGLEGVKEIRLLQRIGYFTGRLMVSFSRTLQIQRIMQLIQNGLPSLIELVTIFGLLGVVITLFASGREPETVIPVLTVFTVALVRMKGSVRSVMRDYTEIRHSSVSLDVVYNGLSELEGISSRNNESEERIPFTGRIEIEDMWFRYPGTDTYSLRGINLTIRKGEAIGFIGSTGAGKSTLLDMILGVLPPTRGEINVDGQSIQQHIHGWQLNLGYIPQMVFLVDGSIKENVALGIPHQDIDQTRLDQAITAANLLPLLNKLPKGVDTVVGERGIRLSGGERQRIAIARALYANPEVLVMDEATSALDNVTEKAVMQAVEALKGDRTILIIAHRLSTVRNCDRIVFLKGGRVDAVGSYQDLSESHPEFMHA